MLDASLALLLARYQQRTVLKIQGASHTRSHDRVSAKGPPWMEMEREVAFVEEETLKASCWTPPWPRRCGRCAPACSRSRPAPPGSIFFSVQPGVVQVTLKHMKEL